MSYHIYHTEGIVLQAKAVGDANVVLFVYTRDMGLIIARATSLRSHKSRLRFALQRFSRAHIDLVRGKHGWLLTSARTIDTNSIIFRHKYRRIVYAVITGIMLRLIQGEDSNMGLYDDVCNMLNALTALETREECVNFELLASVRILNSLGYWDVLKEDEILLDNINNIEIILDYVKENRIKIISRINIGLKSTQL